MRAPAPGLAWEFRRHRRWGLAALAGYVVFVAAFKLLILGPETTVRLNPPDGWAAAVLVPLTAMFFYFLAVFSFGLGGDLAARRSIYPTRLFTLPVTTAALAAWPMLYGALAMSSLWLTTALLARWPWGIDLPFVWPALLASVFLAWTQVLAWMPYGVAGLRVLAAVLWLASLDAAVILAVHFEIPEPWLVAVLALQLPLAYPCARSAVARARRGDVPDWLGAFSRLGERWHLRAHRRHLFRSPARAQAWFEWRRHGRSLPVWVGILLPFELALLFTAGPDSPRLVFWTVLGVLLTPPFIAAFAAATVRRSDPSASGAYGMTPFTATRPVTSAALIAAKLRMAMWSTLAAWLLVLVAIPLGLALSGTWPASIERARHGVEVFGAPRALALALLGFAGLLASTWKQLVQGLCIGLTGREWLIKSSVLLRLSLLAIIPPVAQWISENRIGQAILWGTVPWVLAALVFLKLSAAGSIAAHLYRSRLLSDRALVTGAACWCVVVLALYGLLVWLFCTPPLIPRYVPALVAILAIPLTRVSAAPLALAWNRHRGRRSPRATTQTGRKSVMATVLVLINLPAALAVVEAASFHVVNRNNGAIVSSSQKREYLLYVPASYDPRRPAPLVFSMHGAGGWPALQKETSRWNELAEREGFIVVYPSAATRRGPRVWRGDGDVDVRYISDLIDSLQTVYNIDSTRIYANGISNGGGMAFALSCRLSDRIAAVGMVAAAHLVPFSWCANPRAVPMVALHGTADRFTPYHGGTTWVAPTALPDIPTWTASWAGRNRCGPDPVETAVAPDLTRLEYTDCANDAAVVLYTVEGGGHTWPGGQPLPEWFTGPTNGTIDATRLMWEFFQAHPLR
jgi:polyhydroxybutyrate depolymerase